MDFLNYNFVGGLGNIREDKNHKWSDEILATFFMLFGIVPCLRGLYLPLLVFFELIHVICACYDYRR